MYIPAIKVWKLKNNLSIVWNGREELNTVYINAQVAYGSAHSQNAAYAHAIEHMVEFSPTQELSSEQELRGFAVDYGIESSAETGYFSTNYTGSSTQNEYKELLFFFKERIFESRLSNEIFKREVARIQEESNERTADPFINFRDEFFPLQAQEENSALRRPIGTQEDIKGISLDALQESYRRYYVPENTLLLISGPLSLENKIREELKGIFNGIPLSEELRPTPRKTTLGKGFRRYGLINPSKQYHFAFTFPFKEKSSTHIRFILEMLYLQDSLLQKIRDRFGLYHIEARDAALLQDGFLYLYGATEREDTIGRIETFLRDELLKLPSFAQEKFERIRQKQKGMLLTDFESDTKTLSLIGERHLQTGVIVQPEQLLQEIDDIKEEEIMESLSNIFDMEKGNIFVSKQRG